MLAERTDRHRGGGHVRTGAAIACRSGGHRVGRGRAQRQQQLLWQRALPSLQHQAATAVVVVVVVVRTVRVCARAVLVAVRSTAASRLLSPTAHPRLPTHVRKGPRHPSASE